MMVVKYPSKSFSQIAYGAIDEGQTFMIEARLGKFRKKSIQDYIDNKFKKKINKFSYMGVAMCMDLAGCTARASLSGRYLVEYSDSDIGMILTFTCRNNTQDT